jgi:hypothetical protein
VSGFSFGSSEDIADTNRKHVSFLQAKQATKSRFEHKVLPHDGNNEVHSIVKTIPSLFFSPEIAFEHIFRYGSLQRIRRSKKAWSGILVNQDDDFKSPFCT